MKYRNLFLAIAGTALSFMAGACAPTEPNTEKQESQTTEKPAAQFFIGNMNLTENPQDTQYFEGPIIIWKNGNSDWDLGHILDEKDIMAELELSYKKEAYVLDRYVKDIARLGNEINGLKKFPFFDEIDAKVREMKETRRAESWVATNVSAEDSEDFKNFCHAYVWHLGLDSKSYIRRPRAPAVCDDILKDFFTAEACQAEENRAKKFSDCFFGKTGAQKTDLKFYSVRFQEITGETLEEINAYLWSEEGKPAREKIAGNAKGVVRIRGKFYYAAFSPRRDGKYPADNPAKMIDPRHEDFGRFVKDEQALAGLKKLLSVKDNGAITYNLHDLMYNLSYERKPDDSLYRSDINTSDLLEIESLSNLSNPDNENKENAKIFIPITNPEFVKITANSNSLTQKTAAKDEIKKILANKEVNTNKLRKPWFDSKAKAAIYMVENNMIEALWGYSELTVNILPDYFIELRFRTDYSARPKQTYAKACFDALNNQPLPCTYHDDEFPMGIEIDKKTGKITLTIATTHGKEFFLEPENPMEGLSDPEDIKKAFYQGELLTPEFLNSGTLKMEVFPGSYKGVIPRITGKLFFYDSQGSKLFDGEIGISKADLQLMKEAKTPS